MAVKGRHAGEREAARIQAADVVRTLLVDRVAEDWVFVGRAEKDGDCCTLLEITPERQDWMETLADGAEKVARRLLDGRAPPVEDSPAVHEMHAIPRIPNKRGLVADGVRDGRWTAWAVLALDGAGDPLPSMVMIAPPGEDAPKDRDPDGRMDMARQLVEVGRTLRGVPAGLAELADLEASGTVH